MKKRIISILFLLLLSCHKETTNSKFINLKLIDIDGYGPFPKGFSFLNWDPLIKNPDWKNTEVKTCGVPEKWIQSNINQVWFDSKQFAFQNYKQGKLSEDFFNKLVKFWKIDLTKKQLSEKPIDCFVHIVIGKNENGELEYIIDTNNNKDFSDEEIQKPILDNPNLDYEQIVKNTKSVKGEINTNNGVKKKEFKIVVLKTNDGKFIYNFAQHVKTTYLENTILVSNGFFDPSYYHHSYVSIGEKNSKISHLNEFILINKSIYKNLGVDIRSNELRLQKMPKDTILYSTEIGFNAKPFSIKKLETKDSISLIDYKDKLLFLEFWGTWCKPCINEIPNIKKAYNKTSRKDIDFLGIAVHDTKMKLKNIIEEHDIEWTQVLESESKKMRREYNVKGYPTSFLINKKGKIIAKNLRGEKLLDTLNYYINQQNKMIYKH